MMAALNALALSEFAKFIRFGQELVEMAFPVRRVAFWRSM